MSDDNALLSQYAPYVYFHSEENYFSSSVDWYLGQTELFDSDGAVQFTSAPPTAQQLADTSWDQKKGWYLQVPEAQQGACYPGVKPDVTTGAGSGCYAYVQTSGSNKYLNYWFFYPFNGSVLDADENKGAFAALKTIEELAKFFHSKKFGGDTSGLVDLHEGDWEHMIVALGAGDTPEELYLSQHASGSKTSWKDIEKYNDPNGGATSHPIVYCARHSHATYPTSGEHADPSLPFPLNKLPAKITVHDLTNKGAGWATWIDLGVVPYDQHGPTSGGFAAWSVPANQGWLTFSGYWGRFWPPGSPISDSTGPVGPAYHSEWVPGVPDFARYS